MTYVVMGMNPITWWELDSRWGPLFKINMNIMLCFVCLLIMLDLGLHAFVWLKILQYTLLKISSNIEEGQPLGWEFLGA